MGSVGVKRVPLINRDELDKRIEQTVRNKNKRFSDWEDMRKWEIEDVKESAKKLLDYFEENNLSLITESNDVDGWDTIRWFYSGKDKSDGRILQGVTSDAPKKESIMDTMRGNGISARVVYPENIANYLLDHTNYTVRDVEAADIITTQALKEYRDRKKRK